MNDQPRADIVLTVRTSGWVEITNNGGGNYAKTIRFLEANRRHMSSVSFGNHGYAGASSHAIKENRVSRFIEYAAKNGLLAEVGV